MRHLNWNSDSGRWASLSVAIRTNLTCVNKWCKRQWQHINSSSFVWCSLCYDFLALFRFIHIFDPFVANCQMTSGIILLKTLGVLGFNQVLKIMSKAFKLQKGWVITRANLSQLLLCATAFLQGKNVTTVVHVLLKYLFIHFYEFSYSVHSGNVR